MTDATPFDEGLQAERTLLAWRRTALAFVAASLVGTRVMADAGPVVIGVGLAGIALGGVAYLVASARYRTAHAQLVAHGTSPRPGLALAAMSASVLMLGIACAAYVLAEAVRR
ncbi:DUF202 domain-containing protein [Demequina sp. SO4-18]|uniref:DUF202 domain-containing protein n=1 Tax=Demequina sp. SO4-18 TaxID=3401026 RepID=UPI003B597453